jgi:hypothetical protein
VSCWYHLFDTTALVFNSGYRNLTPNRDGVLSQALTDIHPMFGDFQSQGWKAISGRHRSQLLSLQCASTRILPRTGAQVPSRRIFRRRIFRRMNARPTVIDAIRLRLMKEWLARARCPLLANGYPAWKCRKNYLALVRKHSALAHRYGFRESDLYRM